MNLVSDGFPNASFPNNIIAALHVSGFNKFYLDPANGNDNYDGRNPGSAKKTLAAAYALLTAGQNDILYLMADGTTGSTARNDSAFTWAKSETHLVGICAPSLYSQRARIAPTSTTAAFTPYFTISGNGCIFQNISWFMGFTAGTTSQIGMIVTGSRNVFQNCHIAGMADTDGASGTSTGSRDLKLGGSGAGENYFNHCVIGADTKDRTVANANIEFVGGAVRNVFEDCIFPIRSTNSGVLVCITAGASTLDRYNEFINCRFLVHGTTITAVATLAASSGGFLLFKNCSLVKITGFGSDATTRTQVFIDGGAPAAATTGLAVAPTA